MEWLSSMYFKVEVLLKKTHGRRRVDFALMSSDCDSRLVEIALKCDGKENLS